MNQNLPLSLKKIHPIFQIIPLTLMILFINSVTIKINAQTSKADSLENLLSRHLQKDTVRVNLLNETADIFFRIDIEKTFGYVNEANRLSEELSFTKGLVESLYIMSLYYQRKMDYYGAIKHYQKIIPLKEESFGDKSVLYKVYRNLAFVYSQVGDYPASLNFAYKSLQLAEEMADLKSIEKSYSYIANVYSLNNDFDKALEYYLKSIEIGVKDIENNLTLSGNYNNVAYVYREFEDYNTAMKYHNKALQIYIEKGLKNRIAGCYNNMGDVSELLQDNEKALSFYNKALKICIELEEKENEIRSYMGLSSIFFKQSKKKRGI